MMDSLIDSRQMEILLRLTQGQCRAFVAMKMKISVQTLSTALTKARIATETKTNEQLIAMALRRGWIR